jgi:hypothetical protein
VVEFKEILKGLGTCLSHHEPKPLGNKELWRLIYNNLAYLLIAKKENKRASFYFVYNIST